MHRMVRSFVVLLGISRSISAAPSAAPSTAPQDVWSKLAEMEAAESGLVERDTNCMGGMDAPYDSTCWNTLDITKFLTQWNQSSPRCGPHDDESSCCGPSSNPQETWSNCFLRMTLRTSGHDCSVINTKNCLLEDFRISPMILPSLIPKVRYVIRNIYAMNNLFNSWYTALQYATDQAGLWVGDVTQVVDKVKSTNIALTDVFVSLLFGFAFLGLPGISKTFGLGLEQVVTKAIIISIQQAPNVGRSIWPKGSADTQIVQISNLQTAMAGLDSNMSAQINAGLETIMSDVPSFLAFGASGIYSNSTPPSLPAQTAELNLGFKTFVATTAMAHNYWRGSFNDIPQGVSSGPDGNPQAQFGPIAGNGKNCKWSPDGLCIGKKDWAGWISPDTNRAYVLDQSNHKNDPTSLQMARAIVDKQWSSLEFVLDGAYNCSMAAGMRPGGTKPVLEIGDDGNLDISCMSQLPMIIQCQDVCPAPLASNVQCPFPKWDGCKKG